MGISRISIQVSYSGKHTQIKIAICAFFLSLFKDVIVIAVNVAKSVENFHK